MPISKLDDVQRVNIANSCENTCMSTLSFIAIKSDDTANPGG